MQETARKLDVPPLGTRSRTLLILATSSLVEAELLSEQLQGVAVRCDYRQHTAESSTR